MRAPDEVAAAVRPTASRHLSRSAATHRRPAGPVADPRGPSAARLLRAGALLLAPPRPSPPPPTGRHRRHRVRHRAPAGPPPRRRPPAQRRRRRCLLLRPPPELLLASPSAAPPASPRLLLRSASRARAPPIWFQIWSTRLTRDPLVFPKFFLHFHFICPCSSLLNSLYVAPFRACNI